MIQALRSAGPVLGTVPLGYVAIIGRWPTGGTLSCEPRLGPIVPLAPGMPGMVWHAPQPFCWIDMAPAVGLPAAAGGGAGAGAGGGAAPGAGEAAGAAG